jgi:MFS family permease
MSEPLLGHEHGGSLNNSDAELAEAQRKPPGRGKRLSSQLLAPTTGSEGSRKLFKFMCMMTLVTSCQTGAVPSMLTTIEEEFDMDYVQQGLLGCVVYFALTLSCPCASFFLHRFHARWVLMVSLIFFLVFVLLFALTPTGHSYVLIGCMGGIGFCQAYIMVFSPVWLDEFSPPDKKTGWMALLQSMTPLGVMTGYALGTISSMIVGEYGTGAWRWPFFAQAALVLPCIIGLYFVPHADLDVHSIDDVREAARVQVGVTTPIVAGGRNNQRPNQLRVDPSSVVYGRKLGRESVTRARMNSAFMYDDVAAPHDGCCSALCRLLTNGLFVFVVLSLSGLYFVVSGIQYWGTKYMTDEIGGDPNTVKLLFILTSATAPILGVFVGGSVVDSIGGYRKNPVGTIRLAVAAGLVASILAAPVTYVNNMYACTGLLWGVLFAGGSIVPAATGLFIGVVDVKDRAMASSIAVLSFNVLGYGMSPLASAFAMSQFNSLRIGFRLCLYGCVVPLVSMCFAWWFAAAKDINSIEEEGESDMSGAEDSSRENSDVTTVIYDPAEDYPADFQAQQRRPSGSNFTYVL